MSLVLCHFLWWHLVWTITHSQDTYSAKRLWWKLHYIAWERIGQESLPAAEMTNGNCKNACLGIIRLRAAVGSYFQIHVFGLWQHLFYPTRGGIHMPSKMRLDQQTCHKLTLVRRNLKSSMLSLMNFISTDYIAVEIADWRWHAFSSFFLVYWCNYWSPNNYTGHPERLWRWDLMQRMREKKEKTELLMTYVGLILPTSGCLLAVFVLSLIKIWCLGFSRKYFWT